MEKKRVPYAVIIDFTADDSEGLMTEIIEEITKKTGYIMKLCKDVEYEEVK